MKNRGIILLFFLILCSMCAFCQEPYYCDYEVISDDEVLIKTVYNKDKDHYIEVYIDKVSDAYSYGKVAANSSKAINKNSSRFVRVTIQGAGTKTILDTKELLRERKAKREAFEEVRSESAITPENKAIKETNVDKSKQISVLSDSKTHLTIDANEIIIAFTRFLDSISYYSSGSISNLNSEVDSYIDAMKYMDKNHKQDYVSEKQLNGYVTDAENSINQHKLEVNHLIADFINRYSAATIIDKQKCLDEMYQLVSARLAEREDAISKLSAAIKINEESALSFLYVVLNDKSMRMYISLGVVVLLLFLVVLIKIRKKKNAKAYAMVPVETGASNEGIVVRRKTTSILKKQSLEDVHNNPSYLKIDCAEFCDDSAVRRIYVKNTCIKDIYNMYQEDLRNPENPNEDGCMVIGRWTHDSETDEYYVSLEEIVKPGDDAVFQEYELNFGGKIKLKVSEKLRKLRRETNLQYDMTCWVHSHPGLGVFFSNADSSVQMQLKHPTHPKFLAALVIDILTPNQELGIFTFKHDLTINSKADLKKMYSLEEMYKWAVSSDRSSYKKEDYYNLMSATQTKIDECSSILLSNGAIIDICQMETDKNSGLAGWVHGYECKTGTKIEFVATKVSKESAVPDNDLLGCFVIGTHRSIPTLRRIITNVGNIKFVLFYSTTDGLLTSIPVVDGLIVADEKQYGEEKLEELKIWTRRKR